MTESLTSNLSAELRNPAYNDESDGHVRLRAADEIDRLTERLAGAYASVNLLTEMLEAKAPQEAGGIYDSAWVIEGMWSSTAYPEYWVGSSAWSSDPYKALRFASKESAQQAADMMLVGINHRVAFHEFAGNANND
jgi:hypothetical protein